MMRKERSRGRRPRMEEPKPEWIPKTSIGRRVKAGEILSIEEIYAMGKPLLEEGIADHLLPGLTEETLDIMNTQRMTDCGRKAQFRAIVLVGDHNGHVGIGAGKSEEVRPAIETAARNARRNIVCVPIGCGSWECGCKTRHSLPIQAIGKNGSVEVTLKPAPRGLGVAANPVVRKVLMAAGIKDAWSFSRGHTENVYNMAMATTDALDSLNRMRYRGDWKEMASAEVEKKAVAEEPAPVA
ncbi:MAG: 30S ribosomal protein S5 [Candidatus Marsarchaeota archaeon]|nr:30S ribosomal protein S5 [Candidatus Marsarchaeota archaeon]